MAELDDLRAEWFKALAVGAPLLATSLAITYDFGFFSGADIAFFTFFSISEHVVFALQAIPFFLAPALGIIGMIGTTWYGYHQIIKGRTEVVSQYEQMGQAERDAFAAKLKRNANIYRLFDPIVQIAFVVLALWLFAQQRYVSALLTLVSVIVAKLVYPVERWESKHFKYTISLVGIIAGLAVAFTVGYERSVAIIASKRPTERIYFEEQQIDANLIRAGERGLLFKSFETGKLSFLPWDKIKQIASL
jgi:hypothetical protein